MSSLQCFLVCELWVNVKVFLLCDRKEMAITFCLLNVIVLLMNTRTNRGGVHLTIKKVDTESWIVEQFYFQLSSAWKMRCKHLWYFFLFRSVSWCWNLAFSFSSFSSSVSFIASYTDDEPVWIKGLIGSWLYQSKLYRRWCLSLSVCTRHNLSSSFFGVKFQSISLLRFYLDTGLNEKRRRND